MSLFAKLDKESKDPIFEGMKHSFIVKVSQQIPDYRHNLCLSQVAIRALELIQLIKSDLLLFKEEIQSFTWFF